VTTDELDLIADAARRAMAYLNANPDGAAAPTIGAIAALDGFETRLPDGPTDPAAVLDQLDRLGSPATMRSTGGRYFGFVNGGTEPAGLAASILTAAWDQNVAMPVMSPAATHLDAIAADWIVELLGLPATATATFCGGASVANLTAVLAARDTLLARVGWDVDADGLAGAPPLRMVAGAEIHVSVAKALRAAGLGRNQLEIVPTDTFGRLDAGQLPDLDDRTIVLLQAGNVNTGHSDPFDAVISAAHHAGAWVHVDGAFGLWSAADPERAHLVAGVDQADSWATDAHKWLNAPYDAGVCIVARDEDLRRAMAVDATYLQTSSDRALMHLGIQMSQRARGVETWAILASLGRSGLAEMIDRTCRRCTRLAEMLSSAGAEILAPVVINQALAAFGDDDTTDRVIAEVQADGTCWAGGTTWQGRRAMRLSISSTTTTDDDIDISAAAILAAWERAR
jgi:glutamate/tyrosine decarboxylase-like PLP-dependent enzyme